MKRDMAQLGRDFREERQENVLKFQGTVSIREFRDKLSSIEKKMNEDSERQWDQLDTVQNAIDNHDQKFD